MQTACRVVLQRFMSTIPKDSDIVSTLHLGKKMEVSILVHVKPNSKKTGIEWQENQLFIRLNSPPVDNKANKEVCEVISDIVHVPKGQVSVIRGGKSKEKEIQVLGISQNDVLMRLKEALQSESSVSNKQTNLL